MVDLNQIRMWADEAVRTAEATAGISLDYSRSSIGPLERALDTLRQEGRDEDATWDLACRFGAYLGEVMLKDFAELTFAWAEDYDGEPCLMISREREGNGLDKILPITKCNKYLASGKGESVAKLYAMCLSMLKGGDAESNLESLGVDPSQVPGVEPAYVIGGKFNANAAAWLLYGDYVFFLPEEIQWDGKTHRPVGLQINAAKMRDIPTLVGNTAILNGLIDLLMELERDEGLRVPLSMIHPGLHGALRDEDLTGITLFNLMAQAQALIVKETSPDTYAVMCDSRLPMGIPSFYQLVARMVWGMRAYNGRAGAFRVGFANARNLDADVVLGDVGEMVPGALSQAIWELEVAERPQVVLPSDGEARAFAKKASRAFASGFDEPTGIQADEGLFEAALDQLAREFPLTRDIEGTHHMGRIPRIEHVRAGDPLVLAADWQSEWFDPVCIEVFNASGETLGNLREGFSATLSGNRELACLLPHVTATVEAVTPKSKRRRNAKYALMDVRMELDPGVLGADGSLLPGVVEDAKALLGLPRGERVVLSKGGLVASRLNGNIEVGEAHDAPNTPGGTFRLWEVEEAEGEVPGAGTQGLAAWPSPAGDEPLRQESAAPAQGSGRWTFEKHQLAQGRRFTIEVPDQYVLTPEENGRPLARYVEGIDDESEYPEIINSTMLGDLDEESQEMWRDNFIPEARVQMQRKALYSNDMSNKIMRTVDDWVIVGRNCQVLVFEMLQPSIFPGMFPDSYEYHVKPVAYDHEDYLRITDTSGRLDKESLRELALAVAATVELDAPVELRRPAELERYRTEHADADSFCETVTVVANVLNMAGSDRMNANLYRAVRQAGNEMQVMLIGDTMPRIQAEAFNASLEDEVAYFERIVRALETQARLGADGYERMWELAGEFADGRIVDHVTMDDEEAARKINALGLISIPGMYADLRRRWEELAPRSEGEPARTDEKASPRTEVTGTEVTDDGYAQAASLDASRQAEAKRRADELELDAGGESSSELRRDRDGLLLETPDLPQDFVLAYGDKLGSPFALKDRAERMQTTIESTLVEKERVRIAAEREAAALHAVRTQLVCALRAMVDKRAEEEVKRAEEVRRAEEKARLEAEAKQKAEEEARRKAKQDALREIEKETARKVEQEEKAKRIVATEAKRKAEAEIRQRMQDARIRLNEATSQSNRYSRDCKKLENQIKELDNQINDMRRTDNKLKHVENDLVSARKELDELGFFAFGKKSELRKKIQQLEKSQKELCEKLPADFDESIKRIERQRDDVANKRSEVVGRIAECQKRIDASTGILVQPLVDKMAGVKKGDILEFGRYPQSSSDAGREPVKWQVLEKMGDRMLLLSTLVLDYRVFNESRAMGNDYQTSDLKRWMIQEFKTRAFGSDEQLLLDGDPFIMGLEDFKHYFKSKASRMCGQTRYARTRGKSKEGNAFYWLSTAGDWGEGLVYYINPHGDILGSGKTIYSQGMSFGAIGLDAKYDSGVRPAIWVKTRCS